MGTFCFHGWGKVPQHHSLTAGSLRRGSLCRTEVSGDADRLGQNRVELGGSL